MTITPPGTCRWTTEVRDRTSLAIGALRATHPAYLIHAEHGGAGIAPGTYVIRRQRQATAGPIWRASRLRESEPS